MNLEQIEKDIDNKVDINKSYTDLKNAKREINRLLELCKAHYQIKKDAASLKRKRAYYKNQDMIMLRSNIKESFISTSDYKGFIDKVSPEFRIDKDDFNKTKELTGLLDKLNYLATFINK